MDRAFAKAAWRLIPFMGLLYVASFLDRVNVGFAALTMNRAIGLDAETYGFGAGIFFFGYFLFEVPSNIILEKVGARLWICRIMLSWGLISMATAFVKGPTSFYAARFLLGLAEAGFFPGMMLYLTYWFPSAMLARFIAMFLAAVPVSGIIGGPISGYIMALGHFGGLQSWQWLFLLEGLPSCLLAFAVLVLLPDGPAKASWLSPEEKAHIAARLAEERPADHHQLLPMLKDARVWLLAVPDFGIVIGLYAVNLWLPQIVKNLGFSNVETGFVVAVPYIVSALAMVWWGHRSDVRGERIGHVAFAALVAAAGFFAAAWFDASLISLVALTVASAAVYAALSVFWTLPPSFLGGTAAAAGIALINSISNLGGFFGPALVGTLKQMTGGYGASMAVLGTIEVAVALIVVAMGRSRAMGLTRGLPDNA